MIQAICIGHAAWDIAVWVPEYPGEDSKCEVQTVLECSGGPAANAACLLARWGVRTAFAGFVGDDHSGERVRSSLRGHEVDVTTLQTAERWPTPLSVIVVNEQNGSRTLMNRSVGADAHGVLDLHPLAGETPRLLHFDGHELKASLEAMQRWPDAVTVLDAGSLREGTRILSQRVRYLIASERFARQIVELPALTGPEEWERGIAALWNLNGNEVVITLGARGLIAGTPSAWKHVPAFPAEAVDTTGAGDIFHGAFSFGILRGMEFHEALRLASAAGARSVEQRGSSTSIPRLEDCRAALRN